MNYGLSDEDLVEIIQVISTFKEIEEAAIFGSRAKGNYKKGSDIDIGIYGEQINFDKIASLKYQLEEFGTLPFYFDIVDVSHLENAELKEHIKRVGKTIWKRE